MCYNNDCTLEIAGVETMAQADSCRRMELTIPAGREYGLVAGMALSAMGVLAGLDVDLLGDVRTVASECLDCLIHQAGRPRFILVEAGVQNGRLQMAFRAQERQDGGQSDTLALEITRGVLETLMPDVQLHLDAEGVYAIECSMPV